MFTRMTGSSLKGIDRQYKLTYYWMFDSTNVNITNIPANTDFLILFNAYYEENAGQGIIPRTGALVADTPLVTVTGVGETAMTNILIYGYPYQLSECWTSITWTSATTATVTRQNTGGLVQVFAAQYID